MMQKHKEYLQIFVERNGFWWVWTSTKTQDITLKKFQTSNNQKKIRSLNDEIKCSFTTYDAVHQRYYAKEKHKFSKLKKKNNAKNKFYR